MTRKNNLNIQTMTEQEIKEALKQFKECFKSGLFTYTHADPLKEYCYISSGNIEGLYFPNSKIKQQTRTGYNPLWYDFTSVSKVNNKLGFVVSFNENNAPETFKKFEVNDYIFISFFDVLYSYEEQRAMEELNANITDLQNDLKVINNIKYITKKDGQPFKDIFKNINPQPEENIKITYWINSYNTKYTLSLSETKTSKNGDKYNCYYHLDIWNVESIQSLEDLQNTLSRYKEQKEQHIKEYQNDIKNIKKIFKKARDFKKFLEDTMTYTTREAVKKYL